MSTEIMFDRPSTTFFQALVVHSCHVLSATENELEITCMNLLLQWNLFSHNRRHGYIPAIFPEHDNSMSQGRPCCEQTQPENNQANLSTHQTRTGLTVKAAKCRRSLSAIILTFGSSKISKCFPGTLSMISRSTCEVQP